MIKRPSEVADKIIIRLPDGMRDKLRASARANKRTLTGEVVARLEASYMEPVVSDGTAKPAKGNHDLGLRVAELERKLDMVIRSLIPDFSKFSTIDPDSDA